MYCILRLDPRLPHCPLLYCKLSGVICVAEVTNCDFEYLKLQGIVWCDNCSLSLLTTTTITTVPNIGVFGRVAFINMIKELVVCGNQWFVYQITTYSRTHEHEADVPTVCQYAGCLLLEASDALDRILFIVDCVKSCINGMEWQ